MKKINLLLLIFLIFSTVFSVYLYFFYPQKIKEKFALELYSLEEAPVLKNEFLPENELELSATAAYALDLSSLTVLYEKNSLAKLYPASTSKMMTALVATDVFTLDKELLVTSEASTAGNKLPLQSGQLIRVEDLLAALMISSANDSAYVLANNHPLGFAGFVDAMNLKSQQLNLLNTHFANPAGLDEDGQFSTARDLTVIAATLLQNNYLKSLVATAHKKIENQAQGWSYDLYNSNQLLGKIQGIAGVKTGTTELAGEVLVTLVERDGHQILITLMNSQDRYQDTSRLIAWILNNYEWKKL